jgi:hypothetical protein
MAEPGTDALSPLAHDIIKGAAYEKLLAPSRAPSRANELLSPVTPDQLLTVPVTSYPHAYAMLAGLWLWHNGLHECHEIVQKSPEKFAGPRRNSSLNVLAAESGETESGKSRQKLRQATATFAFWHAIMHRREGDFSNSKYWYAHAEGHPILPSIGVHVGTAINHLPADKSLLRVVRGGWDPDAFVDLVQDVSARRDDPRLATVVAIQRIEWQMLFDHCTREASGG